MDYKNKIWLIIIGLLANQNKVSILNLRLHTVSFCSHKKTILDVASSDKCDGDWDFFLWIFIDDLFPFISTLSESIDWKLDNIVDFFSDFFSNKTISMVIFDKISFEYELIEFIQNSLRVRSSDFICNFSERESLLIQILLEKSNQSFL